MRAGYRGRMLSEIADELIEMTDEDLRLQQGAGGSAEAYRLWAEDHAAQLAHRRVTTRNADRLGQIMDEHGWPTAALVGPEAARRAWLIAQHADRQLDIQRRALALMAAADTDPAQLAMLRDRVLVNEGREQLYGTQIAGVRDGVPVPWPCVEPERLDERRAGVGLPSFAAHTAAHAVSSDAPAQR
jgi:hypothetical protein